MARKIRKPAEGKQDLMRWLLTYADMITLLMLYFIILFTMSSIDAAQYKQISSELQNVFTSGNWTIFADQGSSVGQGLLEGVTAGQRVQGRPGGRTAGTGGQSALQVQALSSLQDLVKGGKVKVIPTERGFAVSLVSDFQFASSSADLGSDAYPVLQEVADFLGQLPNSIVVEGHTDSTAVDSRKWSSNWQLSAARALAVLQTLADYGIQDARLSAAAYGDTRPVQSNDTAEGRAYNRRVDIVIVEQQ
jgi:chemotaxis protein MotB